MTKFADPSFSVAAPMSAEYAEGYERTFPKVAPDRDCTACLGTGKCAECSGTGLRAWQIVVGDLVDGL